MAFFQIQHENFTHLCHAIHSSFYLVTQREVVTLKDATTQNAFTLTVAPPQVSQGDATEKLAHQVAAQVAAADRRVEEASGDPHEEEKDEAHKSSKGHVSGKYGLCCTSAGAAESPRAEEKPRAG